MMRGGKPEGLNSEHVFGWFENMYEETLNLIDDNQVDIIKNWLQNNDK